MEVRMFSFPGKALTKIGLLLFGISLVFSCAGQNSTDVPSTGDICGQVTDQITGDPIPGINIITDPTTGSTVTDQDGNFFISQVPLGSYSLEFQTDLYNRKQVSVYVTGGGVASANITLIPNSGILSGKVFDLKTNQALTGVSVKIIEDSASSLTDANGVFRFPQVGNGNKTLEFSLADYQTTTLPVLVSGGSLQNLSQALSPKLGSISGVISDSKTGLPLLGVSVSTFPATSTVITDSTGAFSLAPLVEASYTVALTKDNYAPATRSIQVSGGEEATLSLTLASSVGSIVGIITDSRTGQAVANATISTNPSTTGVVTDAYGAYNIPNVSSGLYTVSASKDGYIAGNQQVVLAGGASGSASLVLSPATGQLTGKVTNANGGAVIVGATITTTPATVQVISDANGDFVFNNLPPGSYTLSIKKTSYVDGNAVINVVAAQDASVNPQLTAVVPELSVAPSLLDFGATTTLMQVTISNSVAQGALTYLISKPTEATWLAVSSNGSQTVNVDMPVQVTVDRSDMAPGNYSSLITITSNGGNKSIPISMIVPNPSNPQLSLNKTVVDFSSTLSSQQIILTNSGQSVLNYQVTEALDWLVVSPASGNTNTVAVTLTLNASRVGLTKGQTYTGVVTISSNGGNQTIGVSLKVSESAMAAANLTIDSIMPTSAKLSWSFASPSASFGSYKVYSSTNPNVNEVTGRLDTTISIYANPLVTVRGTAGTKRYYKVYTCNKTGVGTESNEKSVLFPAALKSWTLLTAPIGMTWADITITGLRSTSDADAWAFGFYSGTANFNKGVILRWDEGQSVWLKEVLPDSVGGIMDFLMQDNGVIYALAKNNKNNKTLILWNNGLSWQVLLSSTVACGKSTSVSWDDIFSYSGVLEQTAQGFFWSAGDASVLQRYSLGSYFPQGLFGKDLVKTANGNLYSAGGNYSKFTSSYSDFRTTTWTPLWNGMPLNRYNGMGWTEINSQLFYDIQKDSSDNMYLQGYKDLYVMKNEVIVDTIANFPSPVYFPLDSANIWFGSVGKIEQYNGQIYRTAGAINLGTPYVIQFHRPDFGWMAASNGIYIYK
jgi:hypothetical protein